MSLKYHEERGEENTFHPHGLLAKVRSVPAVGLEDSYFILDAMRLSNCEVKGHNKHKTTLTFGTNCKFEDFPKARSVSIIR